MMRLVEERLNPSPPTRMTITLILIFLVAVIPTTYGWSNGGYSSDPNNPDYGTHDFLANHALDWVTDDLDFWLRGNVTMYLYGTEVPDNVNAPLGDGIGDARKHHVYYRADGTLQDHVSARRAQESYDQTVCESINFAVNLLADVIYSVAQALGIPEFPNAVFSALLVIVTVVVVFRKRRITWTRADP